MDLFIGAIMKFNYVDLIGLLFGFYLLLFNKHFAQSCAKSRRLLGWEKYAKIAEEQENSFRILSILGGIFIIICTVLGQ